MYLNVLIFLHIFEAIEKNVQGRPGLGRCGEHGIVDSVEMVVGEVRQLDVVSMC